MIKSMHVGCKCTAMDLIFSPYILYSLSLWKQPLTVELKYLLLLLTVSVWPWFRDMLNLQNSLAEEKVRVANILIKVTRLEWSLWKTKSSDLHQSCFTVPQLFPFWDKWHFRAFQVAWVMQRGGGQEGSVDLCASVETIFAKLWNLTLWIGTKYFSSSTRQPAHTECQLLDWAALKGQLNPFCTEAAQHLLITRLVRIIVASPEGSMTRGGMSTKGEKEGSHPAAIWGPSKLCKCSLSGTSELQRER